MYQKLKLFIEHDLIFNAFLIILVGVGAFLLGRLSASVPARDVGATGRVQLVAAPIMATTSMQSASSTSSEPRGVAVEQPALLPYVASKSGTKYHLTTCGSAKQIKDSNRIYFATTNEAEAAGYTKASNCPGL